MFPQEVCRIILVNEQPLCQSAIQSQFQNLPGFELSATGSTLADIEPLIQQHQPHVAILEAPFPHPIVPPHSEPVSLVQVLQRLRDSAGPKILILANRLEPNLIPDLGPLNIRGYLLKHDPLTLRLPDAVRMLTLGGSLYSEAVLHAEEGVQEPTSNGILTPRQLEVLNANVENPTCSYVQYAEQMGVTESTWDSHLCNIYNRLGVNTLTAAILRAVELGLLSLDNLYPNGSQNACAPNKQTRTSRSETG